VINPSPFAQKIPYNQVKVCYRSIVSETSSTTDTSIIYQVIQSHEQRRSIL